MWVRPRRLEEGRIKAAWLAVDWGGSTTTMGEVAVEWEV